METKYSTTGYLYKVSGELVVLWPLVSHLDKLLMKIWEHNTPKLMQMDYLQAMSYAAVGVAAYFIGDRMHSRELEEHRISLLENRLSIGTKGSASTDVSQKVTS